MTQGAPGAAIHVRVPTSLRGYAGGKPGLEVDRAALGDRPTVGALLDHLAGTHPDLFLVRKPEEVRDRW